MKTNKKLGNKKKDFSPAIFENESCNERPKWWFFGIGLLKIILINSNVPKFLKFQKRPIHLYSISPASEQKNPSYHIKKLTKNIGLCCKSSHIFVTVKHLIFSFKARRGLQRQNCSRQNSAQANTARSLTPRSVSLCWVGLRAVLVTFGSSEN